MCLHLHPAGHEDDGANTRNNYGYAHVHVLHTCTCMYNVPTCTSSRAAVQLVMYEDGLPHAAVGPPMNHALQLCDRMLVYLF